MRQKTFNASVSADNDTGEGSFSDILIECGFC